MNHKELHEKAQQLSSVTDLESLHRVIQAKGVRIRHEKNGRFGLLCKFAEYRPRTRQIVLYGPLTPHEEKCALAHEWLHLSETVLS